MPKNYASSGAAGAPIPKPKLQAVAAVSKPVQKPKAPPKAPKTPRKSTTKHTPKPAKKPQIKEEDKTMLYTFYGSAGVVFLATIGVMVYLMTPTEVNTYKQRQFEATMQLERIDSVPISYNPAYSDLSHQDSQFLSQEITPRIDASLKSQGLATDEIKIEKISSVSKSGARNRGLDLSELQSTSNPEPEPGVEVVFATFSRITDSFLKFFDDAFKHFFDDGFKNFDEILENSLKSFGLDNQIQNFELNATFMQNLENYKKLVKEFPDMKIPGIDLPGLEYFFEDAGFCDEKFDLLENLTLVDSGYFGPKNSCLEKSECVMFSLNLLIEEIDNFQQNMTYALAKFNLPESKEFRTILCQKFYKLKSKFLTNFEISKIRIKSITEGLNLNNKKSKNYPLVSLDLYGNFMKNFENFRPVYEMHQTSYQNVDFLNQLSSTLITKLKNSNVNILAKEQGLVPGSEFIYSFGNYDEFLVNSNAAVFANSGCACRKSVDVHFLVETRTDLTSDHYAKVDKMLSDLVKVCKASYSSNIFIRNWRTFGLFWFFDWFELC